MFKNASFFSPGNVSALSEEDKKSFEGVVTEKECTMRSRILTVTKPRELMVCQLNSSDSFGMTLVMIY